jgi:YD repeat-containing protein
MMVSDPDPVLPASVAGAATYVQSTDYDAAGRVDLRKLGNDVLRTDYVYFAWTTANGRLQQLKTGTPGQPSQTQDLSYSYDDAGNVLTIADTAAYGGSQTQGFSYDALNRLATAAATGGSYGAYSQRSYQYSNAGNPSPGSGQALTSFEGAAFAYNDAAHKHAVTHVGGVQTYWYDQDGNVITRSNGGLTLTLTYDAENRLTGMSGAATESHIYDGDGVRVRAVITTPVSMTSIYVGNYFEITGGITRTYYYAGSVRVAERYSNTLYFLLTDHPSTALRTGSGLHCHDDRRQRQSGDRIALLSLRRLGALQSRRADYDLPLHGAAVGSGHGVVLVQLKVVRPADRAVQPGG